MSAPLYHQGRLIQISQRSQAQPTYGDSPWASHVGGQSGAGIEKRPAFAISYPTCSLHLTCHPPEWAGTVSVSASDFCTGAVHIPLRHTGHWSRSASSMVLLLLELKIALCALFCIGASCSGFCSGDPAPPFLEAIRMSLATSVLELSFPWTPQGWQILSPGEQCGWKGIEGLLSWGGLGVLGICWDAWALLVSWNEALTFSGPLVSDKLWWGFKRTLCIHCSGSSSLKAPWHGHWEVGALTSSTSWRKATL